jgi:hypothetical protein
LGVKLPPKMCIVADEDLDPNRALMSDDIYEGGLIILYHKNKMEAFVVVGFRSSPVYFELLNCKILSSWLKFL